MKIVIVADDNGVALIKPFGSRKNHQGEAFWIADKKFIVRQDNRIKIGKKFMEEHGFLRSDGRLAIIIETGMWLYKRDEIYPVNIEQLGAVYIENDIYGVRGGVIQSGKQFEQYYEKQNGYRIPIPI